MKKINELQNNEKYTELADFFKIFGDSTRLRILVLMREGEIRVTDIAERLALNQSAISHQLRMLKHSRLVKNRRDGKNVYYSFNDEHIQLILKLGIEHILEV